jgi:hypothetical protein
MTLCGVVLWVLQNWARCHSRETCFLALADNGTPVYRDTPDNKIQVPGITRSSRGLGRTDQ